MNYTHSNHLPYQERMALITLRAMRALRTQQS